jgi:hypothetical protein
MIFEQIMRIKGKMQLSLNTRSLKTKNFQTIHVENINWLTWHYMTWIAIDNGLEISSSYGTVKTTFMEGDTCVVQKWRDIQESFSLTTPQHFHCAKLLFGTFVGLGIRVVVPLSVKNKTWLEQAKNHHSIHVGDSTNVVPLKNHGNESVGRGLFFRFMPSTCVLTIKKYYPCQPTNHDGDQGWWLHSVTSISVLLISISHCCSFTGLVETASQSKWNQRERPPYSQMCLVNDHGSSFQRLYHSKYDQSIITFLIIIWVLVVQFLPVVTSLFSLLCEWEGSHMEKLKIEKGESFSGTSCLSRLSCWECQGQGSLSTLLMVFGSSH